MVPAKPSLAVVDQSVMTWGVAVKIQVEKELGGEPVKLYGLHVSPLSFFASFRWKYADVGGTI